MCDLCGKETGGLMCNLADCNLANIWEEIPEDLFKCVCGAYMFTLKNQKLYCSCGKQYKIGEGKPEEIISKGD